jgi:hypothetical protein
VNLKLKDIMVEYDIYQTQKDFNPEDVKAIYEAEVNALVGQLKTQELKNLVYSILMGALGCILAVLYVVPCLGIPLLFESSRNYLGSFFAAPKMSATLFQESIKAEIAQLHELIDDKIECYSYTNTNMDMDMEETKKT